MIDESVLHRPIGGRQVMRAQFEHLLELGKRPNVTLQLVPYRFSGYAAEGSFTMLRFAEPELPDVVCLEYLSGALYLDKRSDTELYSRVFDRLTVDAHTPDDTRQVLAKLAPRSERPIVAVSSPVCLVYALARALTRAKPDVTLPHVHVQVHPTEGWVVQCHSQSETACQPRTLLE